MHELSIAMSIVEIAEDSAKQSNVSIITEIELEVGEMSGVVYDALEFAMEEAVKDTILQGAKRKINIVEGRARCLSCSHEFHVQDVFTPCPECASFDSEVIAGKELRVKSLQAE